MEHLKRNVQSMTGKDLASVQMIDSARRAAVSIEVIAVASRSIPPNYQPVVDGRIRFPDGLKSRWIWLALMFVFSNRTVLEQALHPRHRGKV